MVLMGYQIHSNKWTCMPHQYHCQLNSKCLSWEWLLWPVGTGLYTELKKLVPYGTSRYSSNQASFQEPDPFQWESAAASEWCLDLPESYSNQSLLKCIVQVSASDITQHTSEMHHSASEPFHFIWNIQSYCGQRKIQAILDFAAGFVISDKQREPSPSSKFHNKAKKVLL